MGQTLPQMLVGNSAQTGAGQKPHAGSVHQGMESPRLPIVLVCGERMSLGNSCLFCLSFTQGSAGLFGLSSQ